MPQLFIFDLDHTLVNLLHEHDKAINAAFRQVFGVRARFTEIDYAGKSIPQLIKELGKAKKLPADEVRKKLPRIERLYQQQFIKLLPRKIRPLPGAISLLKKIRRQGKIAAIYTGGLKTAVHQVVRRSGLRLWVKMVETTEHRKRREEMLRVVMKKTGSKDVTVIGDSIHDVRAGKTIGAKTIAVTTGPHSRQRLLKEKPDKAVNSLMQVIKYV